VEVFADRQDPFPQDPLDQAEEATRGVRFLERSAP
jgi:hypothetical protein